MHRLAILLLIAWPPVIVCAQGTRDEPPKEYRPLEFSNIVGVWSMRVEAQPTEVRVEEAIRLRVILTGEGPPEYEPNRKYLKLFPESFEADFYVQELRDEHRVQRDANTWVFVYRLKPKHEKVKEIDGITLWYYNPKSPAKRKYVPIFAPAIPLVVRPKSDAPVDIEVRDLDLPASYYEIPPPAAVIGREAPFAILAGDLIVALALPPILCIVFVLAWRRWFPDDAERAVRIRRKAAEKALSALRSSGNDPHEIVGQYLAERLDFVPCDPTPTEAMQFLKRLGLDPSLCTLTAAYFAARDADRFAGQASSNRQHLTAMAIELINALEADRCMRS